MAIYGGTVCATHGGSTPQVKRKAAERVAEEKALRRIEELRRDRVDPGRSKYGRAQRILPARVTDPYAALEELAAETLEFKDQLRAKVDELEGRFRYASKEGTEQLRAEVSVYSQLLRDSVTVLSRLAALGLDDRRIRIQEAQAAMVTAAILAALTEARLPPAELERARHTIAKHLRQA